MADIVQELAKAPLETLRAEYTKACRLQDEARKLLEVQEHKTEEMRIVVRKLGDKAQRLYLAIKVKATEGLPRS